MYRFRQRLLGFLFPAESDGWLAILRAGLGLEVVLYALSLRNDWNYLFAGTGHGFTGRDLGEALLSFKSSLIPRLDWLVNLGHSLGLSEATLLSSVWILLTLSGCCLFIGVFSRSSSIIAWFLHLCAAESGQLFSYGMDNFLTVGLFYLMISPLPDQYSFDRQIRKLPGKNPYLLGFFRRVLQVHLCLIYFFAGIAKSLGNGWWDGSNMWRALTRPPFDLIPSPLLVRVKALLIVAGILVCLIETAYPVFIWFKQTRSIWLLAVVAMHAAIGLIMGMYLFALIMIVLNLAAFGSGAFRLSRLRSTLSGVVLTLRGRNHA